MDQDEKPLKAQGKAGQTIAPNPVMSGAGVAWNNGVATQVGSNEADKFIGSAQDDVFLTNGTTANGDAASPERSTETIEGRAGHDTAVLPGFREDYRAVLPHPTEYPSATAPAWEKNDTLYGKVIALENIQTGGRVLLRDVETVVFDNGNTVNGHKQAAQGLPAKIEAGEVNAVATQELVLQAQADLSPVERRGAQIAATRECAQAVAADYKLGMGVEAMTAMAEDAVQKLDQGGIKVEDRKPAEPDAPTAAVTQRILAPGIAP
jgi:hypothetical protein